MTESELPRQGYIAERADRETFEAALAAAVEYRGDVTISVADGSVIEGYIFDLTGDIDDGSIGFMTSSDKSPRRLDAGSISRLEFTGKDTAEGKSFETWIEKYVQKKLAGERASIECDSLED
ncbi:MAG: hypothetical protein P8M22_01315 [Phycisphaerales bacterium]|nr:hypothetical protein [Phycisphaerales bacterium]